MKILNFFKKNIILVSCMNIHILFGAYQLMQKNSVRLHAPCQPAGFTLSLYDYTNFRFANLDFTSLWADEDAMQNAGDFVMYPGQHLFILRDIKNNFVSAMIRFDASNIYQLVVHKNYRKQGLASFLLKFVEFFINQNQEQMIYLTVRENNENAIRLYLKFGFKPVPNLS